MRFVIERTDINCKQLIFKSHVRLRSLRFIDILRCTSPTLISKITCKKKIMFFSWPSVSVTNEIGTYMYFL